MTRYIIVNSITNRRVLERLKWPYEVRGNVIIFKPPHGSLIGLAEWVAEVLIELGIAKDYAEAGKIAYTFFVNEVE